MYVNKVAHDVLDSYIFLSQSYFRKGIEYFLSVYVASSKHLIGELKEFSKVLQTLDLRLEFE